VKDISADTKLSRAQLCTAHTRNNVRKATELIYLRLAFKYEFASKMKGHVQCCYTPHVHKQSTAVIDEPHDAAALQRDTIWLHLQWRISITGDVEKELQTVK
jgi:hypothetical protein